VNISKLHFNNTKPDGVLTVHPHIGALNRDYIPLIAIDTVKIDDHCRFTFTKRIKNIFPVEVGDTLAVYQNTENGEAVLNAQRGGSIVGSWIIKKSDDAYSNTLQKLSPNSITTKLKKNMQRGIPNIMIVDDEEDILTSFKTFLKDEEIDIYVETFRTSHDALIQFTQAYYYLVIIDIRMPDINGLQLCRLMKLIRPDIKVLFASALDLADEFISILPGISTSDIIRKPVEKKSFIEKVENSLSY